jgi:hypothetical protein
MVNTQQEKPDQIQVPVWAKATMGMVRRGSLDPDHPLSTYNYVKNELGLNPSDFGISSVVPYDCM